MRLAVVVMFGTFVLMPSFSYSQQIPKDQCSLLSAADLEPILGTGVTPTSIGDEECRYKARAGSYEIHVKRQDGASQLKEWTQFAMTKPVAPLKDIGDEAFISKSENVVAFRKGNIAVQVSAAGVMPTAPMKYQQGVIEVAKRIAAKLK